MKVAGVKFTEISMPRYFAVEGLELKQDDFCICPIGDREETGFVASMETRSNAAASSGRYPKVLRKATDADIEEWKELKKREKRALDICRQKALDHKLTLKVTNVRFDDKNNKTIFHFTADKRVDFRELVRDLASTLRSRIELWQIGVRDEARHIDGLGICGRRLCCSGFLKDFQPVTIRLAKNQDIFLSPAKLSGCCGRLICCLAFEEKLYRELSEKAAPIGSFVRAKNLQGTVIERNLLNQTYVIQDQNDNKYMIDHSQILEMKPPEKPRDSQPQKQEEEQDEIIEDHDSE